MVDVDLKNNFNASMLESIYSIRDPYKLLDPISDLTVKERHAEGLSELGVETVSDFLVWVHSGRATFYARPPGMAGKTLRELLTNAVNHIT